jgi:hypothetical protein
MHAAAVALLQWQDTKLHARGGCSPTAVAEYQTATCSDSIPNCMHAVAVALLQWQDTKLHARVAALLLAVKQTVSLKNQNYPASNQYWKSGPEPLRVSLLSKQFGKTNIIFLTKTYPLKLPKCSAI